jgi:hypothetical protein
MQLSCNCAINLFNTSNTVWVIDPKPTRDLPLKHKEFTLKFMIKLGDYLGVLASAICILHCALTPIALLIPFLTQIPHHDDFHLWMVAVVAFPIISSLLPGFAQHRQIIVLLYGLTGFACFFLSIFWVGPRYGEFAELIFASIGGVNLIIAHIKNRGYCKACTLSTRSKNP